MFDFGFGYCYTYCYRLYTQIKNIYKIKTHLDIIFNSFNESDIIQKQNFESLKQIIFASGSLYIKFFQWYISKLKSNCIDTTTGTTRDTTTGTTTDTKTNNLINFINYFEDIFEQCPHHDIEHTIKIFNNSMKDVLLENYVDMSTFQSIASGSIGQVYYARRKEDNLEIAIKVKHPNIREDLDNQYEIIKFIKLIQNIQFLQKYFNLYINIDDFLTDINLQCNFNNEANNCKIFQENFKDSSNYIIFPKIIYQSEDLLISEFIEGESFESLTEMQKYQTSINFMCFFYQMLLVDNFLHGDLHCKNWKLRNNKETNTVQIIVYDCGICFQNTSLELTTEFWFSLINYDIESLKKNILKFININNDNNDNNVNNVNNVNHIINTKCIINNKKLEEDINIFFDNILNESIGTSVLIKLIINFFRSNNIIVNKFLLNLSILLCVIEEFLKENNVIDKDKQRHLKRTSMFELITDSQLDIIAFCDVKKCYPGIRNIFSLDMNNKYAKYRSNIIKHNIIENKNNENKLFTSLSLSTLKFRPPE